MDRVRLGRALGKGARLAARTAFEAMDAATSPSPAEPQQASRPQTAQAPRATIHPPLKAVAPAVRVAGGKMFAPLRKASHALWLEFTGTFFALFALSFSVGAWRSRGGLAHGAAVPDLHRFETFCALGALFAYFSVSSFLSARRRG